MTISAKATSKVSPTAALKAPVKTLSKAHPAKPIKAKKPKRGHDSSTIPKAECAVIDDLKLRAIQPANPVRKSELLIAGIKVLAAMSDVAYLAELSATPTIKTGRPSKE